MDESEYLGCDNPEHLITKLKDYGIQVSNRKCQLHLVACIRQEQSLLGPKSLASLDEIEKRADQQPYGTVALSECNAEQRDFSSRSAFGLTRHHRAQWSLTDAVCALATSYEACQQLVYVYTAIVHSTELLVPIQDRAKFRQRRLKQMADNLRDTLGNPFKPISLLLTYCDRCDNFGWVLRGDKIPCPDCQGRGGKCPWFTPTVLRLARSVYDMKLPRNRLDPTLLAILADALEDAGCPVVSEKKWEQVVAADACPTCGEPGFWRSGVGFEHEKLCRAGDCHTTWEPGQTYHVQRSCTQPHPILAQLRTPGTYYHGFWPVDFILGLG